MKRFLGLLILAAVCVMPARAWNCSNPLASRVDVGPTKPAGASAGDGDGQYYIGSDASNPKDYYVCQVPKPPTDPTPSNTLKQKQKQQQNQSQSASSSSKATGGSVTDSGNSSNVNQNSSTSGATATNNGNNANNSSYQSSSTYNEVKQNPGAFAPEIFSANPCAGVGVSAGVGTAPIAGSFGLQKVDKGCDARATAILFLQAGNEIAFAKVMCDTPAAKHAHLTLDECKLMVRKQQIVIQAPPQPVVPPVTVNVTVPTPVPAIPPVVVKASEEQYTLIGTCTIPTHSNGCKRIIDQAIQSHARALRIVGPREASFIAEYLHERHSSIRLEQRLSDDQNSTVSVFLLFGQESVDLQ